MADDHGAAGAAVAARAGGLPVRRAVDCRLRPGAFAMVSEGDAGHRATGRCLPGGYRVACPCVGFRPWRLERDERRASAAAMAHVEATVAGSIIAIVGERASKRLIEKLALALDAFERGRYQDAKKIIIPISRDCPGVELIHEIAGLSMYRMGQWRDAADHLEKARASMPASTLNHPVLADCYRALMRYEKVDELWKELKDASPDPAIVAEGRIVAASAQADKGDIQNAVRIMQQTKKDPAKVREHHLREWYVLADLYDRSGDVINAREWFKKIAHNDPDFSDIRDRLSAIGSH